MKKVIHTEMTYRILSDFPDANVLGFLLKGIAKPEWAESEATKIKWLKEWMDMPDSVGHSKMENDHSYKLLKTAKGFQISFIQNRSDQATVIARLKYGARSLEEWVEEEEYRAAALELAKSIHWVVDVSSPPHTVDAFDTDSHSKVETYFDRVWDRYYDKSQLNFTRKNPIKDIYRWAKSFAETKFDRNLELLQLVKAKTSLKTGRGEQLVKEVLQDLAQNLVDYIIYTNGRIKFKEVATKV